MKYNNLGRSGLKVSELSFGSWLTFGSVLDTKSAEICMKRAFEAGINFFDNAEAYARGKAEIVMGEVLKQFRREDLVISTKIFWGGKGPNDEGLSWKHLVEGTKNSLKRLNQEYVDLLFCHRPDPSTPIEETVRAMDHIIRSGLAFYWGTSEWPAEAIETAFNLAEKYGCIPPTMEQPEYNMLVRKRVEVEYRPIFEKYRIGTTIWSPLAYGILTGKYNDGIPRGSRLESNEWLRDKLTPEVTNAVKQLSAVSDELGCTIAQLAIAWCLNNPNVSTVILGATNVDQLEENLGALDVKNRITKDVISRIEEIFRGITDL